MMKVELKSIKCLAYDFDGVMTDNRVLIMEDGCEAVYVNRSDGLAVSKFKGLGICQVIISTETNPVVRARAQKLGIAAVCGAEDKGEILLKYCKEIGISAEEVMFIGNDVNDISAMNLAGIKGAPADAEKEVLEMADWISEKGGGRGVIRDLYRQYVALAGKEQQTG